MKKIVLTLAVIGCTATLFGQGKMITIDNINGAGGANATSFGLFLDSNNQPYTGALTVTVLGGAGAGSLSPLLAGATPSTALSMLYSGVPGVYLDSTFSTFDVTGITAGGNAVLQVLPWRGSAASYAQAAATDQFRAFNGTTFVAADSFTFTQATGGGGTPAGLPKSLDGMPAMSLVIVPEPSTIALTGLGAAALLIYRRRQS